MKQPQLGRLQHGRGPSMALPLAVVIQVMVREILIHDVLDHWKRTRLQT